MLALREFVTDSPARIAGTYALFGVGWIVVTDWLIFAFVSGSARTAQLQTAKGWAFVAASAGVIYALVLHGRRDLERTNERLDTALQQASILHRVLRHDLRNACTVIQGNVELAGEHLSGSDGSTARLEACLDAIEDRNEQLVELSERSKRLRDLVLGDPVSTTELDLVGTIESQVESIRSEFPNAEISLDLPATLRAEADPRIGTAIHELLTNAVEHGDGSRTVRIRANGTHEGVEIEIVDDGPGVPEMERTVLDEGVESPMLHSRGLGLWIAQTVAARSDGDFELRDNDPSGTIARLSVPAGK